MPHTLRHLLPTIAIAGLLIAALPAQDRPRARDLGITPGAGSPGPLNAITDVAGVRVGQTTLIEGDRVRTGVTTVVPHSGNVFRDKVPGAVFIGNAFGKLAGSTQVQELGTIETPIVLTNTLAVGTAVDAVVRWTLAQEGNDNVRSVNALVGETNDGGLNDIRAMSVTRDHVIASITGATSGPVAEGAVGAGTGTIAFGWKGGIGTSSRIVRQGGADGSAWTVGVLVQSNYGGRLTIDGRQIWRTLTPGRAGGPLDRVSGRVSLTETGLSRVFAPESAADSTRVSGRVFLGSAPKTLPETLADGSCMIIVATDAPLDARDLERLAARAIFAMARTGSTFSNGSGDFAIAFSTAVENRVTGGGTPQPRTFLPTDGVSALFEATMDATEEAIYNSLLKAVDMTGNGRTVRALPLSAVGR